MKTQRIIRSNFVPCSLGRLLVAATERGICGLAIAKTDGELREFLASDFPDAQFAPADERLQQWTDAIVRSMDAGSSDPVLPIDAKGTPFQQQVWQHLCKIPRGQTRTYGDIARAIGQPSAVRAVGRAIGTNPVSILIPCHRVIGSNGSLTGYRWGIPRELAR